jgi:hypothetical protein
MNPFSKSMREVDKYVDIAELGEPRPQFLESPHASE